MKRMKEAPKFYLKFTPPTPPKKKKKKTYTNKSPSHKLHLVPYKN